MPSRDDAGLDLPVHSVRARNLAGDTENRIHEDSVARQHGFAGGLVAGITTYAYMARPAVERWGAGWLEGGEFRVRLEAPVYDGDALTVHAGIQRDGDGDERMVIEARNARGVVCGRGEARARRRLDPADVAGPGAHVEPPADRPPITRDALAAAGPLGARARTFRADRAAEFLDAIDDPAAVFREGPAHPGWVVFDANQVLAQNFVMGPWIHVETHATHLALIGDGDRVSMRGSVAELFERKGHEFVVLDLVSVAERDGAVLPVARFRHTAIYRLAPR